jgi:hypothetical protein
MVAAPRATALLSIVLRAMSAPSAVACARTLHVRDRTRGDGEAVKAAAHKRIVQQAAWQRCHHGHLVSRGRGHVQ